MDFMHIQKDPARGPDPVAYAIWQRFQAEDEQAAISLARQFVDACTVTHVVGLLSLAEDARVICGWRKSESGDVVNLEQEEIECEFRTMVRMLDRYRSRSCALDTRRRQSRSVTCESAKNT